MTLPMHDISPEAREFVASALSEPRNLTEAVTITWRDAERWRSMARSAVKLVVSVTEGPKAANLSAMGAVTYDVIGDMAAMIDGEGAPIDTIEGYRLARIADIISMPEDELQNDAEDAIIRLGLETPILKDTIVDISSNVVDDPKAHRHILVGAALMRNYHIATKISE